MFAVSRVAYRLRGIRFDEGSTFQSFQVIDDHLLRHDFLSSVWHFHAQPPLFNILIGVLMRLPGPEYVWYASVYLALGVALTASLFLLQRELGVPRVFAAVVTTVFVVSPAAVLYENYFFYTYPVAVALCAAALFLVRFVRTARTRDGVFAFLLLASVALVRASYHLVWLVAIVAIVAVALGRTQWRRAIVAGILPVLLVGGWYVKQYEEFGAFASSTWLGMSLAKVAFFDVPKPQIAHLVRAGTLSKHALEPGFERANQYGYAHDGTSGIKVLDERTKANGQPNFGFDGYRAVSTQAQKDAIAFIKERPGHYARNVSYSLRFFVLPGADYPYLTANRNHVLGIEQAYDRVLFWQQSAYSAFLPRPYPNLARFGPQAKNVSWGLVLMYLIALLAGPVVGFTYWRRRRHRSLSDATDGGVVDRASVVVLAVISLTLAYAVLVDNLFELGENNRFRFETDPLVCAIVAFACTGAYRWLRTRLDGRADQRRPQVPAT
ncbi:MAG: hypothetical protein JWL83_1966 [Actinomycetia bacterium]|nr:hypothetical protein [Actinomycetes bacterium]